MKRRLVNGLFTLLLALPLSLAWLGYAQASFVSHNLMADSIFMNYTTMNATQIDSFLNSFPSSCISTNHHFSAIDTTGYNPSQGYLYGGLVSAGTIIYHASQAYHLNPQVILATLQKEQSLVTGTAGCSTLRYVGAVGYGCPDSGTTHNYSNVDLYAINGSMVRSVTGTCVNTAAKAGFSQQVIHGTWLLKFGQQRSLGNVNWAEIHDSWDNSDDPPTFYSGPMTQGNRARVQGGSSTYYDGYFSIDGGSIHMDTGATASLYWYTPHTSGNQNFVNIFEGWFGSAINGRPILYNTTHPDGNLIRDIGSNNVYLVVGQQLYHVPDPIVFASYGWNWNEVRPSTPADLNLTINAANISFRSGTLVSGTDGKVYLLQCTLTTCTKYHIADIGTFNSLGYKFSEVFYIAQPTVDGFSSGADINSAAVHPANTLVSDHSNGKVYLIGSSQKQWIPSVKIFAANHFNWGRIKTATTGDLALTNGTDISYPEGALLRADNSPDVYVIDDTGSGFAKRKITDQVVFAGLGYSPNDVFVDSPSSLPSTTGAALTQ